MTTYKVTHVTEYAYARHVDLGTHVARVMPRDVPGRQRLLRSVLLIEPEPSWRFCTTDHFGNVVEWMQLETPHDRFKVTALSRVEVTAADTPADDATPAWEAIAEMMRRPGPDAALAAEFCFTSLRVPASAAARDYAAESLTPGRPMLAVLRALSRRIRSEFAFRPGVTDLSTPVDTVIRNRAGVCQDFTHLMLAGLRAHGLPARYASGYIRTYAREGQERRRGSDVSHAWVEGWLGPEHGWIGIDPTNDCIVGDEHVMLGWGRDFGDISPLAGIILGGGAHQLRVSVDLEPI